MILLKSLQEIAKMEKANRIVAEILEGVKEKIQPGIETRELDELAEEMCRQRRVKPAFKGYRGYPRSICVSVNEEVVHGIPGPRRLKAGDVVSLDFGVKYDGFYGDAAITVGVGDVGEKARALMAVTEESLYAGIAKVKAGRRLSDISHAVQTVVEGAGFGVIREFVGHGIGRSLHEDPQIPNFGPPDRGPTMQVGMTFAIEPMTSMGSWQVRILQDGWTAITQDGSCAAHFEHSVALTENGVLILSRL
ncbi:MAG: type I methionyl aminopeptidase [Proteobacteria bacterium]|nr:type I methionyl aminopeptidase [Pseudomonadota bacterium]MBU4356898.1 type I methionyl aminopeptidase [Pseudomonadota bacterium]MBU4449084.1 type I methionyl aminopeptidase [Pseudomonadota bacterium]MCG2770757.1 type I methionyl aminopeptidase [Desulfobacterales bacterium]